MTRGAVRINSILVERHASADAVARRSAEFVAEILDSKPDAVLLLPAGSTPIPMYSELGRMNESGDLDFQNIRGFQLDEILGVAPEDPRSFHACRTRTHYQNLSIRTPGSNDFGVPIAPILFSDRRVLGTADRCAQSVSGVTDIAADTFVNVVGVTL